jgi:hypothetical protein
VSLETESHCHKASPEMASERTQPKLTPLQTIWKYCLWCCIGQPSEVRMCPSESCPLHPYRNGLMPAIKGPSSLKAIRSRCLECVGGSVKDVAECQTACILNPFRLGHNPNYGEVKRSRAKLQMQALTKQPTDGRAISQSKLAANVIGRSG